MKIVKLSGNDCGGFKPPKGHLDTQMFPECKNTETDRNIVKKTVERRKKKQKKASIITAKHGDNILNFWRSWVGKKINDEGFVNAVYSMIEEVSESFIRNGLLKVWDEYQRDGDAKKAANAMAARLGLDQEGFRQRVAAVETKPRFCSKCKNPVGKMSDSAWSALGRKCDDCAGDGEKELDKTDPSLYKEEEDVVESKTFNLKQYKIALIKDDGYADGGEPYTDEEMDLMEKQDVKRLTFTFGTTPEEVIKEKVNKETPSGYSMHIKSRREWASIAKAVNKGIDAHLEGFTRSTFDSNTGKCLIHPEEMMIFLRRLYENEDEESWGLRTSILETLGIEEV